MISRELGQVTRRRDNKLYLTNNYSIISKYSASKMNYFKDELLEKFIENCPSLNKDIQRRRTSLVNRGYAARMLAMEWAVVRSIKYESIDCFIVLGSGFDMLPQRHWGECHWIEIDLKEVIETKGNFIKAHWNLYKENNCDIENDIIKFSSLNLTLVSCDLSDNLQLSEKLAQVLTPIRNECRNIAIINEVCLCYSESVQVSTILNTIIQAVCDFCWQIHYIGYEQVKFDDISQFSDIMFDHFASLGHPLKYFPSQPDVIHLFKENLGFDHVTVASMFQIYHNALSSYTLERNIRHLEPFDEFEEMDLYLSHYALVTGVRTFKSPLSQEKIIIRRCNHVESSTLTNQWEASINIQDSPIQRYGHAACSMFDSEDYQKILVTGGFGIVISKSNDSRHRRLDDCHLLIRKMSENSWNLLELDTTSLAEQSIRLDRMHGQICYLGNDLIFLNGGRQGPTSQSAIESNSSIVCRIDQANNHIKIDHIFKYSAERTHEHIRWRHRLIPLSNQRVIQVGGLSASNVSSDQHNCLKIYHFDSDKIGSCDIYEDPLTIHDCFKRHSFGADQRDGNTFLLFGGLKTASMLVDQPIDSEFDVIICDTRAISSGGRPYQLKAKGSTTSSYGCNVHFINDNQFVKLGGVSNKTGLQENTLDLYDLRLELGYPLECKQIPSHKDNSGGPLILTNFASCHNKSLRHIQTIGGGGNYFTFGTYFNKSDIVCKY